MGRLTEEAAAVTAFDPYLVLEGKPIKRTSAEQRMLEKLTRSLTEDVNPLLPVGVRFGEADAIHAFERVWIELIARIGGAGWKLTDPALEELRVKKFAGLLTSRDQLRRVCLHGELDYRVRCP